MAVLSPCRRMLLEQQVQTLELASLKELASLSESVPSNPRAHQITSPDSEWKLGELKSQCFPDCFKCVVLAGPKKDSCHQAGEGSAAHEGNSVVSPRLPSCSFPKINQGNSCRCQRRKHVEW